VATTLGAVAGPNLVTPTGHMAEALGMPALTGPFLLAAAAYILAGLSFLLFLKPDPFLVAKAIAAANDKKEQGEGEKEAKTVSPPDTHRLGIFTGATVLVLTHMVMVAIMTMTPVHMQNHGSELSVVGLIIGFHVAAMYLPSPLTGALVDRFGPTLMVSASGVTLFLSGILAAFTPG